MLFAKGLIRFMTTSTKNKGSGAVSTKKTRHFPLPTTAKGNRSVNIIPCTAPPFKHCWNTNIERKTHMDHILESFALGNMSPRSQPYKENPIFSEAMRTLTKNEDSLFAKLNPEEKAIFETYIDAQDRIQQLTARYNWIDGYRFSLLVTATSFVTG